MGIFDKYKDFKESRYKKRIEKNTKLVKNAKAIKEERQAALDYFANLDDAEIAIPALLQRFEYSLEHGINDSREKEKALHGIEKHKEQAIPLVKEHLTKTTRIAWPIKILNNLADEETIVEVLLNTLDYGDVSFDQAVVDKNYDVLCYLVDYQVAGLADKISHFLKDPDERVRFATVEALCAQEDNALNQLLEHFLLDETPENRRIRATVVDAFVRNGWHVSDPKAFPAGPLVEGVFVTKKGKLERRN